MKTKLILIITCLSLLVFIFLIKNTHLFSNQFEGGYSYTIEYEEKESEATDSIILPLDSTHRIGPVIRDSIHLMGR